MLELILDMRDQIKAPAAAPQNILTADEISALVQRGGNPPAGLDFKQQLPVVKDSDLDFDRHTHEFRSIVDCYALNKKEGVRPYDLLVIFRKTLFPKGMRVKIYDTAIAQAQNSRLPMQAQAVYDEILVKMKSVLREIMLTKQTRVEVEFNQLEMGRLPHSALLTEWERLLIATDDAGISLPDAKTLFRRYMQKLVPDLRSTLLAKGWVLDEGPPRQPKTWQECAECMAQELEGRADAKPPREIVNAIQVGSVQMYWQSRCAQQGRRK